MTRYWFGRLMQLPALLLGVTFLVFMFVYLMPGDPAYALLGELATPESVARLKQTLGLDQPWHVQYLHYLGRLAQGDLGTSLLTNQSVGEELLARFPATVELAISALLIAVVVGVPAGVVAAKKKDSVWDALCSAISLTGVSVPVFCLGLLFVYFASAVFQILPPSGRIDMGVSVTPITRLYLLDSALTGNWEAFSSALRHLILPAVAMATLPMAIIARMTRSAMLDVLDQDYIRTARAKGHTESFMVRRHALKNAMLPVVTVVGLQVGRLLTGSVVIETIFSWPGVGFFVYSGVLSKDFPVIQSGVLFFALVFIVVNLLVDFTYSLLDPRIRHA